MKCIAVAILTLAIMAQNVLAATTADRYQMSGDSVYAEWYSSDSCTNYNVSLHAYTSTAKNSGAPSQSGYLYVSTYDWCTGIATSGYSEANPDWFQLSGQTPRTATLKGNFPIWAMAWDNYGYYEYFSGNAAIDLRWSSNGNTQRTTEIDRQQFPDFMSSSRITSISAPATVSGSVSLDGKPLPLGDTPYATISSMVNGWMNVVHMGGHLNRGQ